MLHNPRHIDAWLMPDDTNKTNKKKAPSMGHLLSGLFGGGVQ
jgi:hypothetical protein